MRVCNLQKVRLPIKHYSMVDRIRYLVTSRASKKRRELSQRANHEVKKKKDILGQKTDESTGF
jgi:hypothetical protein